MALSHVKSNPIADFTGTVTVFNSQGSTATVNATDIVRPSDWNSAHNIFQTISGNTAGSSTMVGTNLVFQGGNGITISASTAAGAMSLIFSGSNQTNQTVASGNIAGTGFTSTTTAGTAIVGTNSTNGLSIAVPAFLTTARGSTDGVGLNTAQSNVTWTVNSNGLSLDARGYAGTATTFNGTNASASITLNSAGLRLDLSAAAGGAGGTITGYAVGNTTGGTSSATLPVSSLPIRGYGVLSVGYSNGSIQLSTPDPVVFTQLSVGNSTGGNTAGNSGVVTGQLVLAGGNGITLSGSTNAGSMTLTISGGGGGGAALSAGTQSGNTGTIVFANSNGITFGMSGSSQVTASYTVPTQTAQTVGLYASSNTTGQSSSSTVDARSFSIVGAGAASVGMSGGSFVISAPNAGAGNVTFSAGANSAGLASLVFSNANGVSFGLNGSTITASAAGGGGGIGGGASNLGNTAGSTGTVTTGNIVFVGSGPISLSQSTGAAGSNATISILGPATSSLVGAGGISLSTNGSTISVSYTGGIQSNFRAFEPGNNTTYSSLGQNSVQMQHFIPEDQIQLSYAEIWGRGSFVSSTNSQVYAQTISYGIYSQGTGANSTQMSLAGSSSMSMNVSYNSNTAAGYTIGNGATSITSSSGGTGLMSQISGPFHLYMPFSTTLQPNIKHAFAVAVSSATTVGTSPWRFAVLVQTVMNSLSHGRIFVSSVVAPATSVIGDREMGVYTATSGALPNTYGTANISIAVSRQQMPFMLEV